MNDKAVIDYIVNLGPRHRLVKLEIVGKHYFDRQTIRERMYVDPASLQFRRGRYSGSYLRRDEEAITNLYQENGFRDVKVVSDVQDKYQGKADQIAVVVHIDEGPQWQISNLDVKGIDQLDKSRQLAG